MQFDSLFHSSAQRQSFRTYLAGLLLPRERPKTLTALAGVEPLVQARRGVLGRGWAPVEAARSFKDAAQEVPIRAWQKVVRRFRDGHIERWGAAELTLLCYGPDKPVRAICATTDRRALPILSTWFLTTNLSPEQAPLGEIVRLYGLRNWIEQGYKQMKDELGWADFMVRSDRAIRRHWALVCCAFSFCWWHATLQARMGEPSTQTAAVSVAPPKARKKTSSNNPLPCWPRLLRAVRAWLTPAHWLARCWSAVADTPVRTELAALLGALMAGNGNNLSLRL
ncbi:MAG: hypothetical protein A3F78_11735 [Burkholderiales bacterium RIFCSPLOWO2_12_FULL_61_40]|nr:MAG: hypothetical protein A3F78_11735 [Burkholderiales bacterium RIFCSPLOWO2_12_FULL_61_40]